jgi:hypothetical protein
VKSCTTSLGRRTERLRAIATSGDLSQRTTRTIAWLRANFAKPLHMEDLASSARMGISTLHHQFRALTAMSPLQYQKQFAPDRAPANVDGRSRCHKRCVRGRLRECEPIQPRVQSILRPTAHSRPQGVEREEGSPLGLANLFRVLVL